MTNPINIIATILFVAATTIPAWCFSVPPASQVSASHCYSIKDKDEKNYCLARAKRQASYCYSIRNSDKKNFCLAEIKGQKSYCYSIKNRDQKNACLARVR